jgi:hypothetical protein
MGKRFTSYSCFGEAGSCARFTGVKVNTGAKYAIIRAL